MTDFLRDAHNQYLFTKEGNKVIAVAKRYSPCDPEECWHRDSAGNQNCPVATLGLLLGLVTVEGVAQDVLLEFDVDRSVRDYIKAGARREYPVSHRCNSLHMTREVQGVLGIHSWHALFEYQGFYEVLCRRMSPEFMLLGLIRHHANEAVEALWADRYRVRARLLEVMHERNVQVATTLTSSY